MVAENEKLQPVIDILEALSGHRPHPTTISRWCLRGRNGRRLPAVKVGRAHLSTRTLIVDWLVQTADQQTLGTARAIASRTPDRRAVDHATADASLTAAGF